MTDADISFDSDSPRTTEGDWEGAAMKQNGVPLGRIRGPQKNPTKVQVAIRYDRDVLAAFRATGKGWQTRMNDALREWLASHPAA